MRRSTPALAICLLATPAVAAMAPQGRQGEVVVMVRDGQRRPVADASGVLVTPPHPDLPAVRGWLGIDPASGGGEFLVARPSRQTGMLSWRFQQQARAGAALISSPSLGALVARLLPGSAQRVTLQPTGLIRTPDDAPCTLYATATVDGHRIVLPAMQSAMFPLPAGRYEAWVVVGDRVHWQRLDFAPGEDVTLSHDGPTRTLQRAANATVTPASRPDLILLGPERERCTLCGDAIAAPLNAHVPDSGLVVANRPVHDPGQQSPIAWPPADAIAATNTLQIEVTFPADTDTTSGRGFVLRRSANRDWQVLGCNPIANGVLRLPEARDGDDWLLFTADGLAPLALPLAQWQPQRPITLSAGQPLEVQCHQTGGDPAIDVRLEYVPEHADAATIAVHTDRRGRADFGRVLLPGQIRASDAAYANTELAVTADDDGPRRLTLEAGLVLSGRVQLPDGAPAGGATVTLRDPRGQLRPATRTTISDADGSFAFPALPAARSFVLFARQRREQRTWSSSLLRAVAGEAVVEVTIRDEDPQLRPPRKR